MLGAIAKRFLLVGDRIPKGIRLPVLTLRNEIEISTEDSGEILNNALIVTHPGAYTVYSTKHMLPDYRTALKFLTEKFNSVVFVSVNDPFVMEEYVQNNSFHNMTMICDFNGALTKALNLGVSAEQAFAYRSKRAVFATNENGMIVAASQELDLMYTDATTPKKALGFPVRQANAKN